MAFTRALVQRLFNISKTSNPALTTCRISSSSSSSSAHPSLIPPNPKKLAPDPSIFRPSLFNGYNLLERLRGMDIARDRIRLEGLLPPVTSSESKVTIGDARKLLRLSMLENVKSKLRMMEDRCISYNSFVEICGENCSTKDQGVEFAKMLDESGTVIVLGDVVYLRPDQVLKAINGLMPVSQTDPNDPRRKELEKMEWQKSAIDQKAESIVRKELWCGLGYLVVQTAVFMRLTFWELTWDVMEPICFYVTSMYFMAGYAFFLRTSKEPSFEGFFESRFRAKQKRLMKAHDFDVERYNELRKACYHHLSPRENSYSFTSSIDNSKAMESCGLDEHNIR